MEKTIIDKVDIGVALNEVKNLIALLGIVNEYLVCHKCDDYCTQAEAEGMMESFSWVQKRIGEIEEAVAKRL